MVRKTFLTLLITSALAAPALAENTYNWTGFYAGINLGYIDGRVRVPFSGALTTSSASYAVNRKIAIDKEGVIAGGQFGYNYLFPNGVLIGLESDMQSTSANRKIHTTGPLNATTAYDLNVTTDLALVSTARTRVGYVLPRNVLVYSTAGLAYGGVRTRYDLNATSATDTIQSGLDKFAVTVGWTVGGGIEVPVSDHFSLRSEYLYADLGSRTLLDGTLTSPTASGSATVKVWTRTHIARVALNYKFN